MAWLKEVDEKSEAFWKEAQDALVIGIHKRNRDCGESKLKFQVRCLGSFSLFDRRRKPTYQLRKSYNTFFLVWSSVKIISEMLNTK